jgi:hypothetical protein
MATAMYCWSKSVDGKTSMTKQRDCNYDKRNIYISGRSWQLYSVVVNQAMMVIEKLSTWCTQLANKMKTKKYHTVRTKSISLTHKYMTAHFSVLEQTLEEKSGWIKLVWWAQASPSLWGSYQVIFHSSLTIQSYPRQLHILANRTTPFGVTRFY